MSSKVSSNKRVAKNTIYLYFRMILILVVSLYTSRVVLAELGVVDYGVYNVVGGVVLMFSFINSSMTAATQRFLTFELGKGNFEKLKNTFAASLNVHIVLGLVILFLAETIGLWFVNAKLVIPPERMLAANIVFQSSILAFFLNITQVPYNATLIAHEKMEIYAYLSILEAVGKLGIALALAWYGSDKLIFYAILVLILQALLLMLYRLYCMRHFNECKFSLYWEKGLYKSLTSFAGWNLFGSIAWLLRNQGMNILLNMFFGPALNAAKGIADKVSTSVMGFIRNFNLAMNPQITKNYAVGDLDGTEILCYRGIKFAFILLFLLTMPTIVNIDYILNLWLVDVPSYTAAFVTLVLVDSLIDVFLGASQFITALSATGRIRNYQIVVSIIIMLVLPIGYVLLRMGGGPLAIVVAMIIVSIISGIARILFCKRQLGFSLQKLICTVWAPLLLTIIVSVPIPILVKTIWLSNSNIICFIINCLVSLGLSAAGSWYIGMNKSERQAIVTIVKNKLNKKRHG